MPFTKRSFFLAATAIELASLLGYGRSQYTGDCTKVINTTIQRGGHAQGGSFTGGVIHRGGHSQGGACNGLAYSALGRCTISCTTPATAAADAGGGRVGRHGARGGQPRRRGDHRRPRPRRRGRRPSESPRRIEQASVKNLWLWTFLRSGAALFSCAGCRDDPVTVDVLSLNSSWQLLLRVLRRALRALQSRNARVSFAVPPVSCSSGVCSCHQQYGFYVSASVLLCRIRLILLGDHCLVRVGNSRDHMC